MALDDRLDETVDPASIHVLLVDDDAAFADRLASFLEDEYGMTADIATSGEEALERIPESATSADDAVTTIRDGDEPAVATDDVSSASTVSGQQPPAVIGEDIDCVVTDYQMPELDGLDLLDAIRETAPTLPVVMFAGQGAEHIAGEALRHGVDDYLQKDTDTEQFQLLAERIHAIVTRYRYALTLRTFCQAVEHAGHSIYITDPDGTILYVNQAFEEITGYTAGEAIGREPSLLKSGVHDDTFYAELWNTIRAGEVWEDELVNERKNGERYVVEQTIAPVTTEHGDIAYFVAINNEITELRRRTEELERQTARMEEFTQTLAHDLQSPLNVAQGRLDLAEQTGDEEQFAQVRQALERMETILDDAMDLATHGQQATDTDLVQVCDVVHRAWDHVVTDDAPLTCEIPDDVVVRMDDSRVCNLFENLFRNAVEHAGPSVEITVGVLDRAPGFYVADDGPGIPNDERDAVFETGYTTSDDGTGFGLAIVREIAAAHDWGIDITESDAGGARFEFTIPTADWHDEGSTDE
ncbi:response regulator [Salarchaeum sp. JOR-1]|uniref:hybrid sensor histidine kinase/response regulator n=1 Tax=Salarchaeum sp. JOR-1 TaxID=2599399 RepID=UPI0011985B54|nr:response regulator [Salarchaeum sp. JOR-1]QDX39514.1 response regulator [Salarchaeum sp. JOR-1]